MSADQNISRRTVAKGTAWAVPAVVAAGAAPAFAASPDQCGVTAGIVLAPNSRLGFRAICRTQSQDLRPTTIYTRYGEGDLPAKITICTCDGISGWYRWRETDTISEFQIEVDGDHVDQNSSAAGYRNPIYLDINDPAGACREFALTYRTSVARGTGWVTGSIRFELQLSTVGQNGPWTTVEVFNRNIQIRRLGTVSSNVPYFWYCWNQDPSGRSASVEASPAEVEQAAEQEVEAKSTGD